MKKKEMSEVLSSLLQREVSVHLDDVLIKKAVLKNYKFIHEYFLKLEFPDKERKKPNPLKPKRKDILEFPTPFSILKIGEQTYAFSYKISDLVKSQTNLISFFETLKTENTCPFFDKILKISY